MSMLPSWIIPFALAAVLTPQPTPAKGTASWYNDGTGLYAAAGPALRKGNWRNTKVRVCANGTCINVRLTDSCQCYRGTSRERIIDLSPAAFSRLFPLSRGLAKVRVYLKETP